MQYYVYALNPVCIVLIIPGHSRREVPRQAVDIVNPGNTMTIHRTWHTLTNTLANFNSLFRVCLIFRHTILRTSEKASGITPCEKNVTHCAGPAYYRMCSTTFTVQNKPAAELKETITHHFFVSELGRRKLSMQPKFVAAQKMLKK